MQQDSVQQDTPGQGNRMSVMQVDGQLGSDGRLRHLLTLEGLPRDVLERLLDRAQQLHPHAHGGTALRGTLAGKAVCTLFFEPSTRTRSSFQLAAQRLGADVLNFDASTSSTTKGETGRDTLKTIEAMGVHAFVVRHKGDGAVAALAAEANPGTVLVNAGDGRSAHPTQGLLDMLTLRQAKGTDFSRLKVLIVGDVKHSRVARSDLHALRTLGAGRDPHLRPAVAVARRRHARRLHGDAGSRRRTRWRRRGDDAAPATRADGRKAWSPRSTTTTATTASASNACVAPRPMRWCCIPGPMNRGIEIDDAVADGPQSRILQQVGNGVAVRMAVLEALLG